VDFPGILSKFNSEQPAPEGGRIAERHALGAGPQVSLPESEKGAKSLFSLTCRKLIAFCGERRLEHGKMGSRHFAFCSCGNWHVRDLYGVSPRLEALYCDTYTLRAKPFTSTNTVFDSAASMPTMCCRLCRVVSAPAEPAASFYAARADFAVVCDSALQSKVWMYVGAANI
jgi:hypothetical protein